MVTVPIARNNTQTVIRLTEEGIQLFGQLRESMAWMILAFFGDWGRKAVSDGFAAISTAPEWYKVAFLVTIAASFGIRALVDKFGFGKK